MEKRAVLLTGATGHLGRAVASRLSADFYLIGLQYFKNKEGAIKLQQEIAALGKKASIFQADLTSESGAEKLINDFYQEFGRLDVLVNMPGAIRTLPWDDLSAADWEDIFRSNLESSYFCLKHALKIMREQKWGRIINIGFHLVEHLGSFPGVTPYAVAKTGLLILTRTAAVAEISNNITVNMVSPGLIEGGQLPIGLKLKEGQTGKPEDVAEAVAFLVSEKAAHITGTNLIIAGSWKM
jgi:3-oxoacyl-[acyl-carrier protein] reductase